MDNKTLKSLIIQLRDNSDKLEKPTFQEIADILESDYHIKRSRQAVQGMYQRAISNIDSDDTKENVLMTTDIINLYCLGYKMTDVANILNTLGYDTNYNEIVRIVKTQDEYIAQVKESNIHKLKGFIEQAAELHDLYDVITYKDYKPTEKSLKDYVASAYEQFIVGKAEELLVEAYQLTDDKAVVKQIIQNLNLRTSVAEISSLL